jgi:hypothetical protein
MGGVSAADSGGGWAAAKLDVASRLATRVAIERRDRRFSSVADIEYAGWSLGQVRPRPDDIGEAKPELIFQMSHIAFIFGKSLFAGSNK